MADTPFNRPASTRSTSDLILTVLLVTVVVAALIGGFTFYRSVRTFVAESKLPIFPKNGGSSQPLPTPALALSDTTPLPEATATTGDSSDPVVVPTGTARAATATPSDTTSGLALTKPLTILVMGIDRRPDEPDIPRTDSIIVVRIDPENGEIGMLSFPRDLYVTIPNYGRGEFLDRINLPYRYGQLNDYPGGGAALAKQTIRRNFGIQVDRYLMIDFNGFRRLINEIGGIEIDVPREIVDYSYPTEDFGTMTVRFEEGVQTMDGDRALIYARTRHSTSDFDRAARQQQVIMAVRDKVLSLDIIPSLTPARIANLFATANESVETDLSVDELFALAQVAGTIKDNDIDRAVIDSTLVTEIFTEAGAQVLLPRWKSILPLVEETLHTDLLPIAATPSPPPPRPTATPTREYIPPTFEGGFGTPGAESTPDGQFFPTATPEAAAPTVSPVEIRNGSTIDGVEITIGQTLQNSGYQVIGTNFADRRDYATSIILVGNDASSSTAYAIQQRFGLPSNAVQFGASGSRVVLIVGQDLANSFAQ